MSKRAIRKQKRRDAWHRVPTPQRICINCGARGPHFVPPSWGDPGFFICEKKIEG